MPPPIKNLDSPPRNSRSADSYIWADYIELLCLVNIDKRISKANILRRVWESEDLGDIEEVSSSDLIDDSDLMPDEFDDIDNDLDFYSGEVTILSPPLAETSQRDTVNERQIDIWFEYLEYRANAFKEFYPFALARGILYCKEDILENPKYKLYIFLLLSSSLKYFDKRDEGSFTNRFEIVSMVALKSYLPKKGMVRLVGKNPLNQGIYNGTKWHKISTLVEEIKETVAARCNEGDFSPQDTGDGGLDLVGWVSLGDNASGQLLLFGQCACGKLWEDKKLGAHVVNWRGFVDFTVPPNNFVFIPYCYRGADGNWFEYQPVRETILIDRLRLIHLLQSKLSILERLHPYNELVDEIIEYSEPLS